MVVNSAQRVLFFEGFPRLIQIILQADLFFLAPLANVAMHWRVLSRLAEIPMTNTASKLNSLLSCLIYPRKYPAACEMSS